MVPVTNTGADALVAACISGQLAALEERIAMANSGGNLDGLFARHVLNNTMITSFAWEVSPFSGRWLERNAGHLSTAPQLAVAGYGLTYFAPGAAGDPTPLFHAGLRELMRRDPDPPDGVSFLHDSRQLTGIGLAAVQCARDVPEFRSWLHHILDTAAPCAGGARMDLIRQHVRGMLTADAPVLTELPATPDIGRLCLVHWMASVGTVRLADPVAQLKSLQLQILTLLLQTRAGDLSVPEAALVRAAAGHIIDATLDSAVLGASHVGAVLRRFTPAMRRWRWDDPARVKDPVQWPIRSEREVQDIAWALLRAVFDDLVDEEPLRKVGHSWYRADFGLPRLGVLVEIKYVRAAAEFKKIEKEILEDSVAYLRDRTTYKKLVVFIYDASASVQEHAITAAALLELEEVIDVVIVCRPSQLPPPGSG